MSYLGEKKLEQMSNGTQLLRDASSLQREVAAQIAHYIRAQGLAPGTQLTELGLAEAFRVSRTPIRAALELLAALGVVASGARRGYFVADCDRNVEELLGEDDANDDETLYMRIASDYLVGRLEDNLSEADLMRRYQVSRGLLNRVLRRMAVDHAIERNRGRGWTFAPMLKSADAEAESYRFRLLLEPAALLEPGYKLDAVRAASSRRAHQEILDKPPERLSPFQFFEANAEFHELVAAGSGNTFIVQAVQQQNRIRRLMSLQWPYAAQLIEKSCVEHLAILDAIQHDELHWASALIRRHLEQAARLDWLPPGDDRTTTARSDRA